MKNTKIVVNTRSKSYPIYFGDGNLNRTGTLIRKNLPNVKKICIISDKNLPLVLLKKLSKTLNKRVKWNQRRPLLKEENNQKKLTELYSERKDIYKLANHKIACDKCSKENIATKIIALYEKY